METCTWAPTVFQGPQLDGAARRSRSAPTGATLRQVVRDVAARIEALGITHLLIAQRWWGTGEEIEDASLDCLAMTSYFAAVTEHIRLVTAIHPGFFQPAAIAKWGASLDALTDGRWAINVVSGWNLQEFDMYGVDPLTHDARYERSAEFIEVLKGAWSGSEFSYRGQYYEIEGLQLAPRPRHPLQIFQGGQSDAALQLAGGHSDWMFLNGGAPEKIAGIISRARKAAQDQSRTLRFAMYAAPLCRETDDAAWNEINARLAAIDPDRLARRKARVSGAQGMWAEDDNPLSLLDSNEGYSSGLIGSPATVLERVREFRALGVDMLHLDLSDDRFNREVLPHIHTL